MGHCCIYICPHPPSHSLPTSTPHIPFTHPLPHTLPTSTSNSPRGNLPGGNFLRGGGGGSGATQGPIHLEPYYINTGEGQGQVERKSDNTVLTLKESSRKELRPSFRPSVLIPPLIKRTSVYLYYYFAYYYLTL